MNTTDESYLIELAAAGKVTWLATIYRNSPIPGASWFSVDMSFKRTTPYGETSTLNSSVFSEDHVLLIDDAAVTAQALGSASALQFLHRCLAATIGSEGGSHRDYCWAKLILPNISGQVVRADIIPIRLANQELVDDIVSFCRPRQRYDGRVAAIHRLPPDALFKAAAAGLIVTHQTGADGLELCSVIEAGLANRLSVPWLLTSPVAAVQTLAIVEGGHVHPRNGGYASSVYLAAKALGIDVVVLDNPGHWLDGPEYAHWRANFVPVELPDDEADAGLTSRIVTAIKSCGRRIDGMMTLCEWYKPHVAQACEELGLPTDPPRAYEIATNKFQTSTLADHGARLCRSVDDAKKALSLPDVQWPVIVKPCRGWSSEGVVRINRRQELEQALKLLDTSRHGTEFLIEPYCNGPEVDVNMVLLDGEIAFFDICDDFPKPADAEKGSSFLELQSVYPSILPTVETELLRDSCLDALRRMGFQNGVFHCEYRVADSAVEYGPVDGLVDLIPLVPQLVSGDNRKPRAWLHEVNPRPPGMTASKVAETTYGVEYWGLYLLTPLRDTARIAALSRPFQDGAQYTSVMVFIGNDYDITRYQGVFDSEDICADLLARRPHLAGHLSNYACFVRRGDKVPHPSMGENMFIAYFNVFSRKSRAEALRLAAEVRSELRIVWK
ncbi:glutathione synthetase ATP-binding domain-like protein [Hypomontagnella submonticulosa]|nr:glutathione synthetase ATP-binding domain-like protein [Hypomontagnella submonticulosa]